MRRQLIALALPVLVGALLLLTGRPALAGGGCHGPDTQGSGTTVELTAMCFSPTVLYIQPGDRVTWTNVDGMTHVVAGTFSSWGTPTTLAAGETMTHQFPTAGIFAYSCPLHYGMNAVVIVRDGQAGRCDSNHVGVGPGRSQPLAAARDRRGARRRAWVCGRAPPESAIARLSVPSALAGQRRSRWPANASWITLPTSASPIPAPIPATR